MAARAVCAQYAPVELEDVFAARGLVEAVYVLRDDRAELPLALELGEAQVRPVRLRAVHYELRVMEAVVFLGIALEEGGGEYRLGRIVPLLVVEPVHAAEIGYPALRGHARPAEEDDVIAPRYPLAQSAYLLVHGYCPPPASQSFAASAAK